MDPIDVADAKEHFDERVARAETGEVTKNSLFFEADDLTL